jgi:hypothetical protein
MAEEKSFFIEVGDEAHLTVDEIWPDGNAPDNPTVEDVIKVIRDYGKWNFATDWGFETHVTVNNKLVKW